MITSDDFLIQQLRELSYPGRVDVTQAVMAEVRKRPLLVAEPALHKGMIRKLSVAVAACAVIAVGLFYFMPSYLRTYDNGQIATEIATVYDYHAGYAEEDTYYEAYLVDALLN